MKQLMPRNFILKLLLTFTLFITINPINAYAINIYGPAPHFVVDENVDITTEIRGDALLVGQNITITRPVHGDLFLIGENVLIDAPVSGDIRVIGATVNIKSFVSGSIGFISDEMLITNTGEIDRDVYGIAANFILRGRIGGNLNLLQSDESKALIEGRVLGNVHYTGPKPVVSDKGNVVGEINKTNLGNYESSETDQRLRYILGKIINSLSLILVAFIFWKFFQKQFIKFYGLYTSKFSENILYGTAAILIAPLAIIFLFISVIGIPIALIISALLLFLLYVSPIFLATWIGSKIFTKEKIRFLHIACGILIFDVVSLNPVLATILYLISIASVFGLVFKLLLRLKSEPPIKD